MDQERIGKFIASCRKEQNLTQANLAEKLGITDRAVSKWETGRSLPDASIMPELCAILDININELFSGERIGMDQYQEMAEQHLLEMRKAEELTNRKISAIIAYSTKCALRQSWSAKGSAMTRWHRLWRCLRGSELL